VARDRRRLRQRPSSWNDPRTTMRPEFGSEMSEAPPTADGAIRQGLSNPMSEQIGFPSRQRVSIGRCCGRYGPLAQPWRPSTWPVVGRRPPVRAASQNVSVQSRYFTCIIDTTYRGPPVTPRQVAVTGPVWIGPVRGRAGPSPDSPGSVVGRAYPPVATSRRDRSARRPSGRPPVLWRVYPG